MRPSGLSGARTLDSPPLAVYSNLRMHGGSNHLLLPTNVLGRVWAPAADLTTVVRVERSTSAWANSIYPGEITSQMAPDEIALLRAAGHVGLMFNAMKARILGPLFAPQPPPAFRKYTLPALELRRLLDEARARSEAFSITYTVLEGALGDEKWRKSSAGRTVTISEDGKGGVRCSVSSSGFLFLGAACAPGELALQPPPGYWPTKTIVRQPYPIVHAPETDEELLCFGP